MKYTSELTMMIVDNIPPMRLFNAVKPLIIDAFENMDDDDKVAFIKLICDELEQILLDVEKEKKPTRVSYQRLYEDDRERSTNGDS